MSDYKHIIVAVDLSEDSLRLCQKALDVADGKLSSLLLVHVVEYVYQFHNLYDPLYYPGVENLLIDEKELLAVAQQRMDKLLTDLSAGAAGVQGIGHCSTEVVAGIPKTEILRLADAYQSDLIVCGSHGRSGLELLLGSTANAILHHAKCDVLAIRSGLE